MARTLIDALREVPDRRGRKGRQNALPAILLLSIAAVLSGLEARSKVHVQIEYLAMCRVSMRMLAMWAKAVELAMDLSQSLARRRHRLSHAKVLSTTHRRGST